MPNNSEIILVNNQETNSDSAIDLDFLHKSKYNYYIIPLGASINPGALVIYRNNNAQKQPLFILFADGRIQAWNDNYSLKYDKA
jgi:hypothetical protein